MRVLLCCAGLALTGCAGMKRIRLDTPANANVRALLVPGLGLQRVQYEDTGVGRLQAQVLMESRCRGPADVIHDGDLALTNSGGVFVGGVLISFQERPAAKRANFTREAQFRCAPVEL